MSRRPVDYASMKIRKCSKCGYRKKVNQFTKYVDASAPLTGWRYRTWCKKCCNAGCRSYAMKNRKRRNERLKKWRKDNPMLVKKLDRRKWLKRYGLDEVKLASMYKRANNACEICRTADSRLCVDHCHKSGLARGILCCSCNTFLGRIEANPMMTKRIAAYLKRCGYSSGIS